MKLLLSILLLCAVGEAQRGGIGGGMRGGMGGGMGAGGARGGMGFGGARGGGMIGGGFRGGTGFQGVHRGFTAPSFVGPVRGVGVFRGNSLGFGLGWGGWGLGWGMGWGGLGNYGCPYSYPCSSYVEYPYAAAPVSYGYSAPQPAVTVVYPPPVVERANPVTREYDESGQEVRPQSGAANASPIYLFAFEDQAIRAASAYWVEGRTLHYVTLQREEKQVSLDTLDRALTLQLNRERRVTVLLP
jgi:hypothetical protein